MKALVLAGGTGVRLRPFSHTVPKQLVPVANKPVLFYGLEAIADAGVTEVGVVVGSYAAQIRDSVGDGGRFGLRISYIPQARPAGLAHCVLIAHPFLGEDDFILYLGDNILTDGLGDFVEAFHATRPDAMVLLGKVDNPAEYGTATLAADGRISHIEEKADDPASNLAVIGAYVFSKAVHQAVQAINPSARDELEITDAIQWLIDTGHPVNAQICESYWKDTGRIDDWLECNRALLGRLDHAVEGDVDEHSHISGPVVVAPTAQITRSRLVGPLIVGDRATVRDSLIGPNTVIGQDCQVADSTIADSMLLDSAAVHGVSDLRASVVGRYARIDQGTRTHSPRLIIGDNSRVVLPASPRGLS